MHVSGACHGRAKVWRFGDVKTELRQCGGNAQLALGPDVAAYGVLFDSRHPTRSLETSDRPYWQDRRSTGRPKVQGETTERLAWARVGEPQSETASMSRHVLERHGGAERAAANGCRRPRVFNLFAGTKTRRIISGVAEAKLCERGLQSCRDATEQQRIRGCTYVHACRDEGSGKQAEAPPKPNQTKSNQTSLLYLEAGVR
ncbi:hypothetical protein IWZ03DRAFT_179651 [Phyllosticta citriasiana]|uniref:Uncharacterized protein n=1 Tax=Phyllosticta citriasiana TaxID=595635 RepID=A0ABR1KPU2_9PEZI